MNLVLYIHGTSLCTAFHRSNHALSGLSPLERVLRGRHLSAFLNDGLSLAE